LFCRSAYSDTAISGGDPLYIYTCEKRPQSGSCLRKIPLNSKIASIPDQCHRTVVAIKPSTLLSRDVALEGKTPLFPMWVAGVIIVDVGGIQTGDVRLGTAEMPA
jgi:hypothetical protein